MSENFQEDFISTVSHELRTPLTSIRGFSQTMLNSWDKLDDDSKKKFLKIIEEQSNRLIHLVENMLAVTKLQACHEKFILKEVKPRPIIDTVVAIVNNQYKSRQFFVRQSKNLPSILVDEDKFQQVMTNLIENSAKYSFEDTTINIDLTIKGDFVSIKVSDNGYGIDEKDYEKIFQKFSRLDNPLTRHVQGNGLGLYITKNLVDKMNGKIFVTSKDNLTTFEVLFPVYSIERQAGSKCIQ